MKFTEALKQMKKGKRVTRKVWLRGDFLEIENGILICDGGFPYFDFLKTCDINANDWKVYID